MWILPLIGYLGLVLGFAFVTLAIASGLYYLSELVEEQTVLAKKFLTRLIYAIIGAQVLLALIDRLPLWPSLLGVGSHVVYLQNLRFFPISSYSHAVGFLVFALVVVIALEASDAPELLTVLVLLNHYLWFLHFSRPPPPQTTRYASPPSLPSFTEIASFFFIQVWLVPFALFVSLSASENVLPSMGSEYATDPSSPLATRAIDEGSLHRSSSAVGNFLSPRGASSDGRRSASKVRDGSLGHEGRARRRGGAKGLVRVAVDGFRAWVGETGELVGLWRDEARARRW